MSVESLPISTLKSTAEWHYYRRNYEKALNFAQRALSTDADLGENDRKELIPLIKRCKVRLGTHKEHSETVRLPNKT